MHSMLVIFRSLCVVAPLYTIATPSCSSNHLDEEESSLLQLGTLSDHGRKGVSEATRADRSIDLEAYEDGDETIDTDGLAHVDVEESIDWGRFVDLEDAETAETKADELQSVGTEFPFVWTPCQPCEIRHPEHGGAKKLEIDIWNYHLKWITTPRPLVLAFHGNGGNVKSMKPQCTKVFNVAGFVCASVAPQSNKDQPSIFVEGAMIYLRDNRATYNIDQDKIFLYGYSGGGHTMLRYMMYTTKYELRSLVKGMISDASAPGDKAFDWKKKAESDGKPLDFPPYLMLHCTEDQTMKPEWSVKKSVANINKANQVREEDNQILYKWVKFTKESTCSHKSLLLNFDIGGDSAVTFIENIMQAGDEFRSFDEPFLGLPNTWPETVAEPDDEASTGCTDVEPPANWAQNTCQKQLMNTNNCAERRNGIKNDGYCHKTCGVCSVSDDSSQTTIPTASTGCTDVEPPANWAQNTCQKQLMNTNNCADRRNGIKNDGYCHKTCGVCSVSDDSSQTTIPTLVQG